MVRRELPEFMVRQQLQQAGYQPLPREVVSRRPLSPVETLFHLFMTVATCGLWGFIWWSRVRGRRQITTYR